MFVFEVSYQLTKGALPVTPNTFTRLLGTTNCQLVDGSSLSLVREDLHRRVVVTDRTGLVAECDWCDTLAAKVVSTASGEVWILLNES